MNQIWEFCFTSLQMLICCTYITDQQEMGSDYTILGQKGQYRRYLGILDLKWRLTSVINL